MPISDVDIPDISRAKRVIIMKSIPLDGTVVQVRAKFVHYCRILVTFFIVNQYVWYNLKNLTIVKAFFLNFTYHLIVRRHERSASQ
jgi:hypothetical protein